MRSSKQRSFVITTAFVLGLTGCTATPSSVKKTFDNPTYTDLSYSDVLVIGVVGDYANRAALERAMIARIKSEGTAATAYYSVVGRNQPITRDVVSNVVRGRGFDAVLLCRLIGQEADASVEGNPAAPTATRKPVSRAIDLFRYDYEELAEPGTFDVAGNVLLYAEMFHSVDERRMWAIESTISDEEHIGQIIEAAADTIIRQLRKDGLLGQ